MYLKKQQTDTMAVYFYSIGFSLQHFVLFGVMFTFKWVDIEQAKAYDLEIRDKVQLLLLDKPYLKNNLDLNICSSAG